MKKILCIVLLIVFLIPSISLALTPEEKEYIKKVRELSSPTQKLPMPPYGHGIIRDDSTGNIFILLKGENQGKFMGVTQYGSSITAVYEK
jgi:hypothetical protein